MGRIITSIELQYRSFAELQALYRKLQQELAISQPGSEDRHNARISLENIVLAISRLRHPVPRF